LFGAGKYYLQGSVSGPPLLADSSCLFLTSWLPRYGNPLGPVQGIGYVNELIARLTRTPLANSVEGINHTLDSDPKTFPLDRSLYVDFTHDNLMASVVSTLGLFRDDRLNHRRPHRHYHEWTKGGGRNSSASRTGSSGVGRRSGKEEQRRGSGDNAGRTATTPSWIFSRIAPFAGRVVTELLMCDIHDDDHGIDDARGGRRREYVRILVNDAIQPLDFCSETPDDTTMCELRAFIDSQSYARENGREDLVLCGW
jgi:Histidine phosphatase superfamily (branch 2)